MTPTRNKALQWFHARGEVGWFKLSENPPSNAMIKRMIKDEQLQQRSQGNGKVVLYGLTDKGRRMLNGDLK